MNGKLIIIEGVDGSGKSTLINGLRRTGVLDYIFNYSYPKELDIFQDAAFARGEYFASIRIFKQLLARGKVVVCDRFHLGEYAYGPVMRRYPEWLADEIIELVEQYMIEELDKKNIYIIILSADPLIIGERKEINKEYPGTYQNLFDIDKRYIKVVEKTKFKIAVFDTSLIYYNNHPERILEEVLNFVGDSKNEEKKK